MNFTVYDKAGKKKPSILSTIVFAMFPTDKKKSQYMTYANALETKFVLYAKQLESLFCFDVAILK